ncbi:3-hydroxyacyl-[acyl-carrier-protein] dehydratase FabA [Oceaniserpentilla sp. 4NH20-0058]|uniref:bifunctional 3-hydroxydecanoyl-ACP dehydratase/trans-2-decenoyl-ACP isomerase n=1 Tax=Oceaniserpentilla sp. 4NH20-0058 TaxID=3127660 RepID=UPI00310C6D38
MTIKDQYTKDELIRAGHGELFEHNQVIRLPRDNMLMLDRITHISNEGGEYGKGEVIAELDVTPDLWFFDCHFQSDPVMPGCLGLDALWQMVGFWLGWGGRQGKGRALGAGAIKFTGEILPTNKLVKYHIHIRRVIERGTAMAIADGYVYVDDKKIYEGKDLRVGLFPGEQK